MVEAAHLVVTCEGCGRYAVVNLMRYRSPELLALMLTKDPCSSCGRTKKAHLRPGLVPHPTVVLEG